MGEAWCQWTATSGRKFAMETGTGGQPVNPQSEPSQPEPWMRGVVPGIDPVIGHLLRASEHIREDIEAAVSPLTIDQIWAKPNGMTSVGFHVKHLAGSTERLCTYLAGNQLSEAQLTAIKLEVEG